MMPEDGHTISVISSNICLTLLIKNTGKISWPKGFKVVSLNTSESAYDSKYNNVTIKKDEEIQLDVFIKNPKQVGVYNYIFSLADAEDRTFGTEFEFEFKVKDAPQYGFGYNPIGFNNYSRGWDLQPQYNYCSPKRNYGYRDGKQTTVRKY